MEPFTITTILTKRNYTKYLYGEIYKRPYYIILTLVGLYLLIIGIMDSMSFGIFLEIDKFIPAIILLISPNVLVLISLRSYSTNPTLQQSRTYIFAEDCIIVKGLGFESTFKWEYIIKLKETKTFLLLFSSKKSAQFIEKNKLTKPELDFIKSKVVKK